jgi:hypothetical protein
VFCNLLGGGNDGGRKRERKNVQGGAPVDETQKLSENTGGLGPMQVGAFTIGRVEEVVGEGGLEMPGYKATKYQAIQIIKLWAAEMIDSDFDYFLYGSTGSTEWRTREYANRRLNTIAKSIGEEEVKRAFKHCPTSRITAGPLSKALPKVSSRFCFSAAPAAAIAER